MRPALGYTNRFTYDAYRQFTSQTNPRGFTSTNRYDEAGNLTSQTDATGATTTYTYDGAGNLLTRVDALQNVLSNRYDSFGHITNTVVIDANGAVLNESWFSYDANGNQTSKSQRRTTSSGTEILLTRYDYDAESRLIQTVYPDGATNRVIFDGLDKPAVEIDPLGRETIHQYDERGNLVQTTYPDGTFELFGFDAEGRSTSKAGRGGRLTSFNYDALGRLTNTVFADFSATNAVYDALGRLTAAIDERGNVTTFGYDPNCGCSGRQAYITNALGQVTFHEYDENANLIRVTDPLQHVTQFFYDENDRQTRTLFNDGTETIDAYDALGRRIAQTDQNTNTTWFGFDALSRLISVTNAFGKVTRYTYDELNSLTSQTDANLHTTAFDYDPMGRRTKRTLPLGQFEQTQYDAAGNLVRRVDFNGRETIYQYDALNRLSNKIPDAFFAASPIQFSYTATGKRASMSDPSGVTFYGYNERDWLTNKATPQGTLQYSYDPHGNLMTTHSLNANGIEVTYEWDELNRLKAAAEPALGRTEYSYDAAGNLQSYAYPNGIVTTRQYDSLNHLTNLFSQNGATIISSYSYGLLPSGHRQTALEQLDTGSGVRTMSRAYTYDATDRLTQEDITSSGIAELPASASITYTLDAVGNRLFRSSTLSSVPNQAFTYDANDRLTSDTYDANGNTVGSEGSADRYDFEDRLIDRNNGQITIVYDGDGNRVRKTVAGTTTLYLVDDENPAGYAQVLEELTEEANQVAQVTRLYVYGLDLIGQDQFDNSIWTASFYGYDALGSTRCLMSGLVTDAYDFDAFGNEIGELGSTPNSYLFRGEQFDPSLGFYSLRARYFNQQKGRFVTRDPFSGSRFDPPSLHSYVYAYASPVDLLDPTGLITVNEVLERIGIDSQLQRAVSQLVRRAAQRAGKKIVCDFARDQLVDGIYIIVLDGALYVGQSANLARRIKEWEREGAKLVGVLKTVTGISDASGKKFMREIVEQVALNLLGGAGPDKPNVNNPINEKNLQKRFDKYDPVGKAVDKVFDLIPMCKDVKP